MNQGDDGIELRDNGGGGARFRDVFSRGQIDGIEQLEVGIFKRPEERFRVGSRDDRSRASSRIVQAIETVAALPSAMKNSAHP